MTDRSSPSYALLTDAPPLKVGGHGCHVLAWNWVAAVGNNLKLVITRRLSPEVCATRVCEDLPVPCMIYPDLSGVRFPGRLQGLRFLLELVLVLPWLPRICARIRAAGANRLFFFCGGSAWFLILAGLVVRRTRLPFDLYLVDDLEESARISNQRMMGRLVRWIEPRMLRRASRVFGISPGFAEHLRQKYDVRAEWLPTAVSQSRLDHQPFQRANPDIRTITFIGAVNSLYLDALKDFVTVMRQWNAGEKTFQLRLLLMTYAEPEFVKRELGAETEVLFRPPPEEFQRRLRSSWALFLPYSFAEEVRVMVSTFFPTKLVDLFPVGRPILAYGPAYASVPRYFIENELPLCAHSPEQLRATLREIEKQDTPALIQKYETLIRQFHAPATLRSILQIAPAQDTEQAMSLR